GSLSDAWFSKPMYDIEQVWLDRAVVDGNAELVERVRLMHKTNGDVEEVVTERLEVGDNVSLSSYAENMEYSAWVGYRVGSTVLPNFQVLWLADALTQENVIPQRYIVRTTLYGSFYIVAAISIGVILFQRREVS
nr:hypothetical protein [Planctomycetota bacterium]